MKFMPRLLIIGCGDVALRAAPLLREKFRLFGLTRSIENSALVRNHGITPILGDLDTLASLHRLGGIADSILHSAPPPNHGRLDTRTRHLIGALSKGEMLPQRVVYISTSGVYGDCNGASIDETRPLNPQTPRAQRRVDAEQRLRVWCADNAISLSILRSPGIYAADRLPLSRLQRRLPVLNQSEDVFTNHIHADDLAQACIAALFRGQPLRAYNICDGINQKMGDYFDQIAEAFALEKPPRVTRVEAEQMIAEPGLSFMRESRCLQNRRMVEELRVRMKYPSVDSLLCGLKPNVHGATRA
ncbi:MAG: SDR family oxidoreductase [Burkholderiales bacterium]